jgi:hypothetical protein
MLRRIRHAHRTAWVIALTAATSAFGFFMVSVLSEGTGTAKLGSQESATAPISVTVPVGLKPGEEKELGLLVKNDTLGKSFVVKRLTITPSLTSAPGCEPSWFTASPNGSQFTELLAGTASVTIPTGDTQLFTDAGAVKTMSIKFTETGTDQSACAGKELSIAATLK